MYAVAFGLLEMQLLCLHVSEHRDLSIVKPIWNQIFEEREHFLFNQIGLVICIGCSHKRRY